MPEAAQLHQMEQAAVDAVHPFVDEVVGAFDVQTEGFEVVIDLQHLLPGLFQFFLPGAVVSGGETAVDAGFGGLLVFFLLFLCL